MFLRSTGERVALAPGLRSQAPDARPKLINYLVANFEEIVYV